MLGLLYVNMFTSCKITLINQSYVIFTLYIYVNFIPQSDDELDSR